MCSKFDLWYERENKETYPASYEPLNCIVPYERSDRGLVGAGALKIALLHPPCRAAAADLMVSYKSSIWTAMLFQE